jgi:chromosome segregation ATPase
MFEQLGAEYIVFEPAIFGHYDMFFVVSRAPLQINTPDQIDSVLLGTPKGRLAQGLVDLRVREQDLISKLQESEFDRNARWTQIQSLTKMLQETQGALQDTRVALQDTQVALQDTQVALQDTQVALQDTQAALRGLFNHRSFRLIKRLINWPEIKKLSEQIGFSNE